VSRRFTFRPFYASITLAVLALCQGCFAIQHHYVDAKLPKHAYSELQPRSKPQPLALNVEFQTNGRANPSVNPQMMERFSKALAASKLFTVVGPAPTEGGERLDIVMNNFGSRAEAFWKGIVTGSTWGLIGTMGTDGYRMTATFYAADGKPYRKEYEHALHTTAGLTTAPEGLEPMEDEAAMDKICEDLVLNLLVDLQKDGKLK